MYGTYKHLSTLSSSVAYIHWTDMEIATIDNNYSKSNVTGNSCAKIQAQYENIY